MRTTLPFSIEFVDNDGYHLFVNILINEKPARMVVDTGASRTIFDINLIGDYINNFEEQLKESEKLSTGLGGNSFKSYETELESIKISKLILTNYPCCILDLQHVNYAYEQLEMPKVIGVLGCDLLVKYNVTISFTTKKITFNV